MLNSEELRIKKESIENERKELITYGNSAKAVIEEDIKPLIPKFAKPTYSFMHGALDFAVCMADKFFTQAKVVLALQLQVIELIGAINPANCATNLVTLARLEAEIVEETKKMTVLKAYMQAICDICFSENERYDEFVAAGPKSKLCQDFLAARIMDGARCTEKGLVIYIAVRYMHLLDLCFPTSERIDAEHINNGLFQKSFELFHHQPSELRRDPEYIGKWLKTIMNWKYAREEKEGIIFPSTAPKLTKAEEAAHRELTAGLFSEEYKRAISGSAAGGAGAPAAYAGAGDGGARLPLLANAYGAGGAGATGAMSTASSMSAAPVPGSAAVVVGGKVTVGYVALAPAPTPTKSHSCCQCAIM